MRLAHLLTPLHVIVLLSSLLIVSHFIDCKQSTVFVLDTSDSDSGSSESGSGSSSSPTTTNQSPKASDEVPENTRIITDSSDISNQSNKQNNNQRSSANATRNQSTGKPQYGSADRTRDQIQNDEAVNGRSKESPSSRRLEEESELAPIVHKSSSSSVQQNQNKAQQNQSQSRHKPTSTSTSTTTSPYEQDQNSSQPKTEERLLISITSEDDDSYKPQKVSSSLSGGSSGYNDEPVSGHNQQVHQHQKRKPAITISIQDANINKQNGGTGNSAVIVRPSEDGQGIVIATVGSSGGISIPSNKPNINIQDPYREPVNNPIQGIIQQHQRPISTTRRPINDPYREPANSNNRPITSTLVEGHRPSQQVTDERPQRPTLDETHYETTSRPLRPTNTELSGLSSSSSSSSHQDYDNNNNHRPNENYGENYATGPKFPLNEKNCGIMHETRIVGGEEADPDDFMWMAAIIKSKPRDGDPKPFCGGSLITRRHILTAAHCLEGLAPRDVLVRLGSYDFEDSASSSSADYAIDQFRVPAQYSKKTHVADIAIMRLKTPLSTSDNYKTVCMPQPRRSYVGALGTVTGYGSQSQQFRRAAPKLRQVTVPIWENRKCSVVYKKNLTESFLCAGYEEGGKDACQGDSGGPLMTEGPDQKMMIVGVVSHGIGCGSPGYPGVYTRTSTFQEWIEKNTSE